MMEEMKDLSNLSPAKGANKSTKRLGRGIGSGLGKTAGKGHKGQKARKSGGIRFGFEGGQTPMYRRIPKFGFNNKANMLRFHEVNIGDLNRFEDGQVVDGEALCKMGLFKRLKFPVKILGNGSLERKLTVKAAKFTESAKKAVEAAGGTATVLK